MMFHIQQGLENVVWAPSPSKQARHDGRKEEPKNTTSDHVVALTQLREQIANLQRQLAQTDKEIFAKDRQVSKSIIKSTETILTKNCPSLM